MNFQNIEVFYLVGQQILKRFQLTDTHQMKLLHRSENVTYAVVQKDSRVPFGVLRISRPGYHTQAELEAELIWLERITSDTGLIAAKPVPCKGGETLISVCIDGMIYYGIMFEYLEGTAPNPGDRERSLFEFEQVGEIAATLHRQVMGWPEGRKLDRPVWNYDALLGAEGLFGDWRDCKELLGDFSVIEQTCERIRERLLAYGVNDDNFGLIHSDLRAANLLMDKGQMNVLDFDDSGYGWYVYDLAASISFLEDDPMVPAWIEAWIRGYEKILPFGEREKTEIGTFVMTRRIQLLAWITSHDDSDPVKMFYHGFAEKTVIMAKRYLNESND